MGRHVLRLPAAGDPARVAVLRAAARDAAARGAADAAIDYLQRALDEPPRRNERGGVLHELGLAEAADRRREDFEAHLRAAAALTEDPGARSRIALDLGRALASCGEFRGSVEIFHEALARRRQTATTSSVSRSRPRCSRWPSTSSPAPSSSRHIGSAGSRSSRPAPLASRTLAPLVVAIAASRPVPHGDAIALAQRALEAGRLDAPNSVIVGAIGNGLIYAAHSSQAARVYHESITAANTHGNRLASPGSRRCARKRRCGWVRSAAPRRKRAWHCGFSRRAAASRASPGASLTCSTRCSRAAHLTRPPSLSTASSCQQALRRRSRRAAAHLARALPPRARAARRSRCEEAQAAGRLVSATIANPYCCDWRSAAALALSALRPS